MSTSVYEHYYERVFAILKDSFLWRLLFMFSIMNFSSIIYSFLIDYEGSFWKDLVHFNFVYIS